MTLALLSLNKQAVLEEIIKDHADMRQMFQEALGQDR